MAAFKARPGQERQQQDALHLSRIRRVSLALSFIVATPLPPSFSSCCDLSATFNGLMPTLVLEAPPNPLRPQPSALCPLSKVTYAICTFLLSVHATQIVFPLVYDALFTSFPFLPHLWTPASCLYIFFSPAFSYLF